MSTCCRVYLVCFQTVNFILQILVQQVFESIRQFCQFIFRFYLFLLLFCFCGRKFVAGRESSREQSFPCRATKTLSQQTSRFVADWTIVSFLETFFACYCTKIIVPVLNFWFVSSRAVKILLIRFKSNFFLLTCRDKLNSCD